MRLTYLLDRPELGGGTKVVAQHADLLGQRGHEVTLLASGARPAWLAGRFRYLDLEREALDLPAQDLVLATFWTTIGRATALGLGPVAHFCQGFEGDLEHLAGEHAAIAAAYRRPLPALTVAPHLAERLAREFGRPARVAPPPVDTTVGARWRWRPRPVPRVALFGIFEAAVKGIETGLAAVAQMRSRWPGLELVRASALPAGERERALAPSSRFLHAVEPRAALAALRDCDLLLFPSRAGEGFGLPLLEAMALGVPAVASRIPSVEFMAGEHGVVLAPVDDPVAIAGQATALLGEPAAWRRQRRAGLAAAAHFAPGRVAPALESAILWAVEAAAKATER